MKIPLVLRRCAILTLICLVSPGLAPAGGSAVLSFTREPLVDRPISPFQYGQFIEYLCNLVPGMWAEKLYDGSFEGLTPYDVTFRKETDFQEHPWYPDGQVNRAAYSLDPVDPVNGAHSQKITAAGGAPCTVGMSQDGIALDGHAPCIFSCYMRAEGVAVPVQVRLHAGGKTLASCEFSPGATWGKFQQRLTSAAAPTNATLTIQFRGPGTLWLDMASLMPEATDGGWRPEVVEALRALKPGVIRFGGSAVEYFDWKQTIGDPVKRVPFRAWGGLQPVGPGLEEIVQLIQRVGAEPLVCVRFTDRTPQDAADEVQYFNGAPDTPMGKLRAANGHPEPYHIRYWQVGNEVGGADYDARLPGFCAAMKATDPSIRLLSSFPSAEGIRGAGAYLDYVCPHQYGVGDLAHTRAGLDRVRQLIRENAPGRNIRVAVTEWNTTGGDFVLPRAKLWTLENALACSRYQNLLHRNADLVEIANRSNLTNSFCSGILQTDNHRLYKTPTYYAQQLYATLSGTTPLRLDSAGPRDQAPDVSATLSQDGKAVTVFAVNEGLSPVERSLDLSAFGARGQEVETWTLEDTEHRGEPDATNSFEDPARIRTVRSHFHAGSPRFDFTFPPLSLTVLRWVVESPRPAEGGAG